MTNSEELRAAIAALSEPARELIERLTGGDASPEAVAPAAIRAMTLSFVDANKDSIVQRIKEVPVNGEPLTVGSLDVAGIFGAAYEFGLEAALKSIVEPMKAHYEARLVREAKSSRFKKSTLTAMKEIAALRNQIVLAMEQAGYEHRRVSDLFDKLAPELEGWS